MDVNNFLARFQADIVRRPVTRPDLTESTALGAALLAALGCGLLQSLDDIAQLWRSERRFEPGVSEAEIRTLLDGWRHAVRQARA